MYNPFLFSFQALATAAVTEAENAVQEAKEKLRKSRKAVEEAYEFLRRPQQS
jgi:hypothetical protein